MYDSPPVFLAPRLVWAPIGIKVNVPSVNPDPKGWKITCRNSFKVYKWFLLNTCQFKFVNEYVHIQYVVKWQGHCRYDVKNQLFYPIPISSNEAPLECMISTYSASEASSLTCWLYLSKCRPAGSKPNGRWNRCLCKISAVVFTCELVISKWFNNERAFARMSLKTSFQKYPLV